MWLLRSGLEDSELQPGIVDLRDFPQAFDDTASKFSHHSFYEPNGTKGGLEEVTPLLSELPCVRRHTGTKHNSNMI